jgi:hypothetical protein
VINRGAQSRPDFDAAAAHPELASVRTAAAAGDWPTVSSFFDGLADDESRAFVEDDVTNVLGIESSLHELVKTDDSAALPSILFAGRHVKLAWDARTSADAGDLSHAQFDNFTEHLRIAERVLIEVTARHPENVRAWSWRLVTARGLELGQSETRRRYDRLAAHNPQHYPAQLELLQQLCPKWGGTWDAAQGFARAAMESAAPGSHNPALVVVAHLEQWVGLGRGTVGSGYLQQSSVVDEISEAAEASVLHPDYRQRFGWVNVQGVFAMAFSLIGDNSRASVHFHALGNHASNAPWEYFDDTVAEFEKRRASALGGRVQA